jgi:small subunit ribosomal protein S16
MTLQPRDKQERSMAVKLRLRRTGAKRQPRYRIVAADSRSPRDGRFIEVIGHYNPARQPHEVVINEELARKWLKVGAQPTDTVRGLLVEKGILSPTAEAQQRAAAAPAEARAVSAAPAPEPEPAPVASPEMPAAPAPEPPSAEVEAAAEAEQADAGAEASPDDTSGGESSA